MVLLLPVDEVLIVAIGDLIIAIDAVLCILCAGIDDTLGNLKVHICDPQSHQIGITELCFQAVPLIAVGADTIDIFNDFAHGNFLRYFKIVFVENYRTPLTDVLPALPESQRISKASPFLPRTTHSAFLRRGAFWLVDWEMLQPLAFRPL